MAFLTHGYTFTTSDKVTPTKFHNSVDMAYLLSVINADLVSGIKAPYITTPGSPATGDVRVGSDGLLEFYFGGAWVDHPANELTLTLTNKSGSNLVTGDVVVADPTNSASFTIASVNFPANVIGVLAADINNNASGLVYVRGVVNVRVATGAGGAPAGEILRGPNGTSGTAALKVAAQPTTAGGLIRSDAFGIMLGGASIPGPTTQVSCFIWK